MRAGVTRFKRNGRGLGASEPAAPALAERVIGIDVGEQAAGFTGVSTSVSTGVMALVGAGVAASLAAAKPGGGVIKLLTASIVGGLLGGAAATGLKYAGREGF